MSSQQVDGQLDEVGEQLVGILAVTAHHLGEIPRGLDEGKGHVGVWRRAGRPRKEPLR